MSSPLITEENQIHNFKNSSPSKSTDPYGFTGELFHMLKEKLTSLPHQSLPETRRQLFSLQTFPNLWCSALGWCGSKAHPSEIELKFWILIFHPQDIDMWYNQYSFMMLGGSSESSSHCPTLVGEKRYSSTVCWVAKLGYRYGMHFLLNDEFIRM